MKRLSKLLGLLAFMAIMPIRSLGQNVQLHYDLGRHCATSTVEMFRPDKGGSTFFFVDLDYSPKVSGAYFEISRELNFWQDSKVNWLSVHVEYNGGLDTAVGSFNNAWLGGLTYSGHSKDWSKTWSLSAMYKAIPGTVGAEGRSQVSNFQITGVWNLDFFDHWLSFYGFAASSAVSHRYLSLDYIDFCHLPRLLCLTLHHAIQNQQGCQTVLYNLSAISF